jgi:fatty-acyl-CoA synthase
MEFVRNLLIRNARTFPEKAALICDEEVVTHDMLNRRINRLANALQMQGWVKGTVVGIFIRNSIEFVEILFACQKLGITATPANTRYRADELRHQMMHAKATVVFFDVASAAIVDAIRSEDFPRDYISVGAGPPDWAISLEDLLSRSTSEDEPPTTVLDDKDIATILYTSGTTGVAKGVPVSYRGGLYTGILEANADIGLTGEDISLCVAPLFHQGVYGMNLMMPLMVGGTVVIQRRFDAEESLEIIESRSATYAFLVPTMSEAILRSPQLCKRNTWSFRTMMSSGSALSERTKVRLHEAFPGIRVFENYGATETFNSLRLAPQDALKKRDCAGLPVLTQQVRLMSDVGEEVGEGEVGEIWVRGPTVLSGYHMPPAGTPPAVDDDGWFRTGDLAQRDADGYYYLVGRSKEMIISGGENIYPREIEDVILTIDGVVECAVAGVPDEYWGEIVCAYVVSSDAALSAEHISEVCAQHLARYKRPREVSFVATLPRNSAGKIVRSALRQARAS